MTPAVDNAVEHAAILVALLTGVFGLWKGWRAWLTERYHARRARDRMSEDLAELKAQMRGNHGTSLRDVVDRLERRLNELHDLVDANRRIILGIEYQRHDEEEGRNDDE